MINKKKLYLSFLVFLFSIGGIGFLYNITLSVHDAIQVSKLSPDCVQAMLKLRNQQRIGGGRVYLDEQGNPKDQWSLLESAEKKAIIEEILKEKYEKQFENFSPDAYLQQTHIREFALSKYDSLFWAGDPAGKSTVASFAIQFLWVVPAIVLMLSKRWFNWVRT